LGAVLPLLILLPQVLLLVTLMLLLLPRLALWLEAMKSK
jgi:hypothetical protein